MPARPSARTTSTLSRPSRRWLTLVQAALFAAMSLALTPAQARALPGAGAPPDTAPTTLATSAATLRTGHAWVIVDTRRDDRGTITLLHIPPRESTATTSPSLPGQPSPARPVIELTRLPVALAAAGTSAWMVFEPATKPDDAATSPTTTSTPADSAAVRPRRVELVSARPFDIQGWTYAPRGTTELQPSLPGTGRLASFVATADGPVALLESSQAPADSAQTRWRILALRDGRWLDWPVPAALDLPGADARLLIDAPILGARRADQPGASLVTISQRPGEPTATIVPIGPTRAEPRATLLSLQTPSPQPGAEPTVLSLRRLELVQCDGGLFATLAATDAASATATVRLYTLAPAPTPATLLAELPLQPAHALAPLHGLGRLTFIWAIVPPSTGNPAARSSERRPLRLEALEVSTITGRTLARGEVRREGPLRARDVFVLAILMGTLVLGVVFFILRGDASSNISLPLGTSLAPFGRRLSAACLDFAPALILAGILTGRPPGAVLLPPPGSGLGIEAFGPLLLALGLTALASTILEWTMGRSLGKALTGLWVVPIGAPPTPTPPGPGQPALIPQDDPGTLPALELWQSLLRNLLRWVPPLALLALMDQARRHPGDLAAGTVVVQPTADLPPEPPADSDPG